MSNPQPPLQVHIDRTLWNKYISKIITVGLSYLENTPFYYEIVNNEECRKLLSANGGGSPQFNFLCDTLANQELTRCPKCGQYNDNVECPILRCSYCDHEWSVSTIHSKEVCDECIAGITKTCDGNPPDKTKNSYIQDGENDEH